jgi:hypothetical protein
LDSLYIKVTPFAYLHYKTKRLIGWVVLNVPPTQWLLNVGQKALGAVANILRSEKQTTALMNLQSDCPNRFGSGFGYQSPSDEIEGFCHYRNEAMDLANAKSESPVLYSTLAKSISDLIATDPTVKNVLNFAVSYAHIDNLLATRHPDVAFTGVDRSLFIKVCNEQSFKLPNLAFVAGDIFDMLASKAWDNSIAIHSRVLIFLPKTFVERYYEALATAGIKYVVGIEQCGISWHTGKPYRFSLDDQPSVAFRNQMFLHNYPALLKHAGFKLKEARIIDTAARDPNLKLIFFIGERE